MTTVYMGLYKDFGRAQRISHKLSEEESVNLADIAVVVQRDAPDVYQKYLKYFDVEAPEDEGDDDESLMDKINPFSGDEDEDELEDPTKRNMTIIFIKDDGNYDAETIREAMRDQKPLALTEEGEDAWIGTGWLKETGGAEDADSSETIEDRRYRSFDWEKGEQR